MGVALRLTQEGPSALPSWSRLRTLGVDRKESEFSDLPSGYDVGSDFQVAIVSILLWSRRDRCTVGGQNVSGTHRRLDHIIRLFVVRL